ncbi:hypothetical protein H072_4781 [Dactylellina haptotyla CBS 200.50]|uniref:N-acetyltransferase domain-containing protein n=1 Tax=Dactylellina haptotyla (strain CBS 200.50) TaxID=1284197 RepID=S8C0X6_DACHA|nr:hypothetical protein H072_4781 [Dactylellina haptotyla CBS 200.50]
MSQANTKLSFHIRPANPDDLPQITEMVNHYIMNTTVNYCLRPVPPTHFRNTLSDAQQRKLPFLVAVEGTSGEGQDGIMGFTTVSPWTPSKLGYAHTLEMSIYTSPTQRGGGVGTALLESMIRYLETEEYLTFAEGGALSSSGDIPTAGIPIGIPAKCKKVLAIMAVDADKKIDEGVKRFYLNNGFREVGYIIGIGWKFGGEQDVRFLMKDVNESHIPGKELGGV